MAGFMSRSQLIFLMLLALGITNHVLIIPHLIKSAGRDAWLSILIAYPALLIWSAAFYWISSSMRNSSLYDWLQQRIGRLGSLAMIGGFMIYVITLGILIVYDTTKSLKIYILPKTPNMIIVVSFVLITFLAAKAGLRTIVYMSAALLPIVWFLGFLVTYMTMDKKDYGMMFPVFSEGIFPAIQGAEIVIGGSMDLLLIMLLISKLHQPLRYSTLFWLLTLLLGLVMGPTLGSLSAFGPAFAGQMRFPAFEQWRLVMIGRYISHVDFLAVFQLLAGSIIRTALCIYLSAELTGKLFNRYRQTVLLTVAAIFSVFSLTQLSDIIFQKLVHDFFYRYSLVFGCVVTLSLLIIRYMPDRKGTPI